MGKINFSWMIKPHTGCAESQNQTTGGLLGFVINGNSKGSCCWFIIGFPVNNKHWSLGHWGTNQFPDIHNPVREKGKSVVQKSSFYFPLLVFQGLIQQYRRNPDLRCPLHLQLQPQHPHPHPNSTELAQGEPEMNVIDLVRAGPGFLPMEGGMCWVLLKNQNHYQSALVVLCDEPSECGVQHLAEGSCALPSGRHPHGSGPGGAGQAQGAEDGPAHAHQAPLHLRAVPSWCLHSPRWGCARLCRDTPSKARGCSAPGVPALHTAAGAPLPGVLREPRAGILGVSYARSLDLDGSCGSGSGCSVVLWFTLAGLRPLLLPSHLFLMDNSRLDVINIYCSAHKRRVCRIFVSGQGPQRWNSRTCRTSLTPAMNWLQQNPWMTWCLSRCMCSRYQ